MIDPQPNPYLTTAVSVPRFSSSKSTISITPASRIPIKSQPFPRKGLSLGCALIGLLASSSLSHAADYQWDINGTAAGLGGTGIWNVTNAFWDDLSAGVNDGTDPTQAVTFSASHTAIFGGTAGSVTMGAATTTTGAITITSGDYIFRGLGNGAQNFNGLTTLPTTGVTRYNQAANNNAYRFNGGINLNGSAISIHLRNSLNGGSPSTATGTISGNGTLTLANNNAMNWNGNFHFSGLPGRTGTSSGTTRDLNMGTGAVTLGGDRIVTVSANTLTVGGVIDDGVNDYSLTKSGAGRLNLDGINTYSGDTIITDGILSILESDLADASSVLISGTAVIDLSFSGIDAVDKLFINGIRQTTGHWGSTDSGATHVDDTRFTGPGTLTVTTAPDPLLVIANTMTEITDSVAIPLSVPVSNNGPTKTLTISAITIGGANAASFVLSSTLPINIAPGGSSTINYTFTPGSGSGRCNGTLQIVSDDINGTTPNIPLTAFVEPAGTVVARFDFAPTSVPGAVADIDSTTLADVVLGSLTDNATGLGALGAGNQTVTNRTLATGINGSYLNFSSNRESDAQTPVAAGGNNKATGTTVSVAPQPGGGQIHFTGGSAVIDTYANTDLGNNTAADWTLYYSIDSGSTWSSLGTSAGQSTTTNGTKGPLGITWDLSVIGNQSSPVVFALDAVSTGNSNGTVTQRGVGFDNLVITAVSITPGSAGGNFATWASGFSIPNDPTYDAGDNDGLSALVEYALGLSPLVSETLANTYNPAIRVISFTKGTEAVTNGDVAYAIETSPYLLDPWTPVSCVLPDVNDGTTISHTLPNGLGKIFARLVVTEIP